MSKLNYEEKAYRFHNGIYMKIYKNTEEYDFTFYDKNGYEIDGGIVEDTDIDIDTAKVYALDLFGLSESDIDEIMEPEKLDRITNPTSLSYHYLNPRNIEQAAIEYLQNIALENNFEIAVKGSSVRPNSNGYDFDVLVQLENVGENLMPEYTLRDILMEDSIKIYGHKLIFIFSE